MGEGENYKKKGKKPESLPLAKRFGARYDLAF
jgi:hypothetical protein